ncbi:hypothetical protein ALO46_101685 [Pseudomonas syringae pv. solidagae]|uniref:Uncharacterized protein n=1 Tax=Pseudomonas syringae pv. solidagae TaxID=264458 RepID=A0A0N8SU30_PSESX|nr:hypothetical protein ALO46_101685 [Pseudomonas syringae pv. solidagae]RMR46417.1 hypothetical protein ALP85_101510 [Pseudomonas syringae pv. syringae]RMT50332.1 hypothetical protein ALP48_03811 [Pseudomonas syringae pv. solidagae]
MVWKIQIDTLSATSSQEAEMRFLELYLKGDVLEENIHRFVEDWHEGREGAGMEMHEYLGMSWEEYGVWVATPAALSFILAARKRGSSLGQ